MSNYPLAFGPVEDQFLIRKHEAVEVYSVYDS